MIVLPPAPHFQRLHSNRTQSPPAAHPPPANLPLPTDASAASLSLRHKPPLPNPVPINTFHHFSSSLFLRHRDCSSPSSFGSAAPQPIETDTGPLRLSSGPWREGGACGHQPLYRKGPGSNLRRPEPRR